MTNSPCYRCTQVFIVKAQGYLEGESLEPSQQFGEFSPHVLGLMLSSGVLGLPSDRRRLGSWWPMLSTHHRHCHSTAAKEIAGSQCSD